MKSDKNIVNDEGEVKKEQVEKFANIYNTFTSRVLNEFLSIKERFLKVNDKMERTFDLLGSCENRINRIESEILFLRKQLREMNDNKIQTHTETEKTRNSEG